MGIGKSLDLVSVSFLQRKTQYSTLQEGLAVTGVMTGPGCLGLSHQLPWFRSTQHWAGCWRGQKTHHCPCPQFPSLLLQRPAGPQSVRPATPTSSQPGFSGLGKHVELNTWQMCQGQGAFILLLICSFSDSLTLFRASDYFLSHHTLRSGGLWI